jgi:hypothetical protein
MRIRPYLALCGLLCILPIGQVAAVDFAHDVLPILKNRCAKCHTAGKYEGDLSLDTRETLVDSGVVNLDAADESDLLLRVTSDDPEIRMPHNAAPLSDEEIGKLREWIAAGLPWEEGFSFANQHQVAPLPPRQPPLPPVIEGRNHPVDRFIMPHFVEYNVSVPPPQGDAAFLRRAKLDIVGLLPTVDELDAFVADNAPDKRTRLVRELLGRDRHYAEHWLSFWNDLLRNDYAGTGYIDGGRQQITGWLYEALVTNKPYDQFVRELIAPTEASEGFIRGIKWRGRVNASQVPELQFAQSTAQVFLGINLKCASCHDSFIDSWKLTDAYGMAAITAEGPLEIHRCDKPTGEMAVAKFLFPELGTVDAALSRDERLKQTAALLTSEENGRLARTIVNRIWQRLMGRGIVEPVDIMDNPPFSQDLLDWLAWDLTEHGYDLKRTIELITTSEIYASQSVVQEEAPEPSLAVFVGPIAKRMTAEQFVDALWQITETWPEKPSYDFGDRGEAPVRAALVAPDLLQRSLGRPNREQVVTTRPAELTMLVALDLTNGDELATLLLRGANSLVRQNPDRTPDEWINWLWRTALTRGPTGDEQTIALETVGSPPTAEGLADLMWSVLMLPEFQMIR